MSEKITVYEKITWTTCRNLAQLFRENNIEYENVDYFIDELTEEKLRGLLKKLALKPFDVLRKKEAVFQELNLSPETPPGKIIKLIVRHPNLLQRPIVEVGERAVIARPVEKALSIINLWAKLPKLPSRRIMP